VSIAVERPQAAARPAPASPSHHAEPREFRDPPPGFGRWPWWAPLVALAAGLLVLAPPLLLLKGNGFPFEATLGEGLFVGVLLAIGYALMARTAGRPSLADVGLRSTPSRAAVGWVIVARVTFGIVSAIYVANVHDVTPNAPVQPFLDPSPLAAVDVILAAVVLAPLGEELFFRGFMYAALRGRMPVFWAALITSALFGAVHPVYGDTRWNLVPILAMAGFAMCLLYEWTGSLWPSIAFHVAMNIGVVYMATGIVALPLAIVGGGALLFLLAPWRWLTRGGAGARVAECGSRPSSASL
jgi:membrane protease YdiL (CAAX protease family)